MAVEDYSTTPASNTTISGIDVGEGCSPANLNDAFRQLMADVAVFAAAAGAGSGQPSSDTLTSLAGLTLSADKGLMSTAANTLSLFDLTAAGRALLDDADAAAQRETLGLGLAAVRGFATNSDLDNLDPNAAAPRIAIRDYVNAKLAGTGAYLDPAPSHTLATDITNSSGRTILVTVSANQTGVASILRARVDDNATPTTVRASASADGGGAHVSLTFPVPDGETYRVEDGLSAPNTAGAWTIVSWQEFLL